MHPYEFPHPEEVKKYLDRRFGQETELIHRLRRENEDDPHLPNIHVSIHIGRLIYLLAKIQRAERILEVGTLGGYSTACLVQALPSHGSLITLEIDPYHANKTTEYFNKCGEKRVEVRVGHAVDLMAHMDLAEGKKFDLIFIDADKENNALYLDWAIRLGRSGTLIIIDNLIPKGKQVGYPSHDEAINVYAFNDYLAQHPLLEVAAIPTLVGPFGRLDALAMAYVKS